MADERRSIIPTLGERALIIGQTGSGKTVFCKWLLRRLPQSPVVIYDTKHEGNFADLPNCAATGDWDELHEMANNPEIHYIVFQPETIDPDELDEYLGFHYDDFSDVPAYIDELYSFHNNYRAGPGLTKLLTRGRSRGLTTIMGTQRPAMISNFAYSESQSFFVFHLNHDDDIKRVAKFVPGFKNMMVSDDPLEKHSMIYFHVGDRTAHFIPPIVPDKPVASTPGVGDNETQRERFVWL